MYQKGRSLFEVLAVLVIGGILTIGGIEFVSYLISKNTANTIQKGANNRAASIMTSPLLNKAEDGAVLTALGFLKEEDGFFWTYKKEETNAFSITVMPIKKTVCNILLNMDFTYLKEMFVNGKKHEEAVCDKATNTFKLVYKTAGLRYHPKEASSCIAPNVKCGLGCCSVGSECCHGMCVEPCSGVGMNGRRDAFTCACFCDETLGLKEDETTGGCVCEKGKHFDGTKCVCDDTTCIGGVLTSDCSCNCASSGKVHKVGNDRECVACNEDKECSSCQTCQNNECVGECCIQDKKHCTKEDECCNGYPCSEKNICCIPNQERCSADEDCCNDSCVNEICCTKLQKICSKDEECCEGAVCQDWKCCRPFNDICNVSEDCCGDKTECLHNKCCLKSGSSCDENIEPNPCCTGSCQKGKCCVDLKSNCNTDEECCGENLCVAQKCCSSVGSTCDVSDDTCCEGSVCVNGICCAGDGFCKENCEKCCSKGISSVCRWTSQGNLWTGSCSKSEEKVYGLDPKLKENRCCFSGEYLVPAFDGTPGAEKVSMLGEKYCCEANVGKEQYTYFNTKTNSCTVLGECPSDYDGIAFVIDMSNSVLFSADTKEEACPCDEYYYETDIDSTRKATACGTATDLSKITPDKYKKIGGRDTPEYCRCLVDKAKQFKPHAKWCSDAKDVAKTHGFDCSYEEVLAVRQKRLSCTEKDRLTVVKKQFNSLFSSSEIKWEDLKIGIYTFGDDAKTILDYRKHALSELQSAMQKIETQGGTCSSCGLYEAYQDTIANNQKAAPLFFLIADGDENAYFRFEPRGSRYKLKNIVEMVQEDCDNLFQIHALGYGEIKSAKDFRLPVSENIYTYSINTSSLKDVILDVTKKNLDNCIPREENEICCKKGTKWDDEDKKCK